jgi:hypothetical protein
MRQMVKVHALRIQEHMKKVLQDKKSEKSYELGMGAPKKEEEVVDETK